VRVIGIADAGAVPAASTTSPDLIFDFRICRVFDGGEPGSTGVERRILLPGMIPPQWITFINANDNDALAVAA